ncbi:unnamed protein product [Medioppia subpectinata]|uniref:ACB domain-containing protein n=1 Tax=Medioppia subpectinata TaxID=1979941 RepID=A0A7R9KDL1_9ACAR|nr:unnamed protein product [Medioppia subpectinata]CAG2100304.1 unnamed protein product [Medioppia subpectinata]
MEMMFGLLRASQVIYRRPFRAVFGQHYAMSSSSGDIKSSFSSAQERVQKLKSEPSNDVKLKLYALFKQSTVGECNTPKPSAIKFVESAKWQAWSQLGSLSSTDAMTQYVQTVDQLDQQSTDSSSQPSSGASDISGSDLSDSNTDLLVENRSGVCVITLNRPNKYNAITDVMYDKWINALNTASADESIKLALITANGDYFSSGNDLSNFEKAFKEFKGDMNAGAEQSAKILQKFVAAFIDFQKPLIGAVNGPAIGIAVTTLGLMDCVVASDTSHFQTPFSSLGQSPEACATLTFPFIMGYSRASEMLYFNYKMKAEEALNCGLISRVIPSAQFKTHVEDWIFGANGLVNTCYPKSMQFSKQLVKNESFRMRLHEVNKEECDTIKHRWVSDEYAIRNELSDSYKLVKLHDNSHLIEDCALLLNQQWNRSLTARLHTLAKSCDRFPLSLVLIDSNNQVVGHVRLKRDANITPYHCLSSSSATIESLVVAKSFRGQELDEVDEEGGGVLHPVFVWAAFESRFKDSMYSSCD